MQGHHSRHPHKRWLKLAISLMITALIAIPLAFLAPPWLAHRQMARALHGNDLPARQRALVYIARHADDKPRVRNMAILALKDADDILFQQIFAALDIAGQWRRPPIDDDAWLRWLGLLGRADDPQARIMAIRQTTHLKDLASDARLVNLFKQWLLEKDPLVRYNALAALADIISHAPHAQPLRPLLLSMTDDPLPALAAEAWVFLGVMNMVDPQKANWSTASLEATGAMLWALACTPPGDPSAALDILASRDAPAALRAAAAYALHTSHTPAAHDALQAVVQGVPLNTSPEITDDLWLAWRAILSMRQPPAIPSDALDLPEQDHPALWALLHQHARTQGLTPELAAWLQGERPVTHPVSTLAILEGLAKASSPLGPCPPTASPYVKLAWTRATTTPDAAILIDLFASQSAPVRDAACVLAAEQFDDATNLKLIDTLLRDFNDQAKMSGAMLAGLTSLRPTITRQSHEVDLLLQKMEDEDIWAVQQMHRVALWMQGRQPEMADEIAGLMSRPDLPVSSLLLALAKMKPDLAMNELFSPLSDPPVYKASALRMHDHSQEPVTLMDLLVRYRWQHVLQAAFPQHDLQIWLWADTSLQAFQLQLIRNRWLVTRKTDATATRAGNPAPSPDDVQP